MRTIKGSLLAKVIAIFMFVILTVSMIAGTTGIVFLAAENAYFDDGSEVRRDALGEATSYYWNKIYRYIDYVLINGWSEFETDLKEEFCGDESNFYFTIKDEEGNILLSNYKDVPYQAEYERIYSGYAYDSLNDEYCAEENYYINAIVPQELNVKDAVYFIMQLVEWLIDMRYSLIIIASISLVAMIIIFIFMMCMAGHQKDSDEVVPNFIDVIPFDVYLCAILLIVIVSIYAVEAIANYSGVMFVIGLIFAIIGWILLFISLSMTFATRVKLKNVFKNTVVMQVLKLCWQIIKALCILIFSIPLVIKGAALYALIRGVEMVFLMFGYGEYIVFWVLESFVLGIVALAVLLSFRKILIGGREISGGKTDYKINTGLMFGEFREHANNLNGIGEGLQNAVDKSIKSERMKAELITNVSHDIKTPLTSIINYVDLLKREGLTSENADEYLEVLDRQSARLKKLTEDLIEASKASTGNIKVNAEMLDVNILLSQAIGEYEEKFSERNLFMVTDMAEGELFIYADGRLLWRVFDNMLNNIVKYAKQDTRVYISTTKVNSEISIVFKNISDAALNISSDELMERFVRGDSSRNTEGSGLGLSIAKSLTELMGGSFEIMIDGDLFKCSMSYSERL